MPKKTKKNDEWIEVVVTFKCLKGHDVPVQFTYLRAPGSMRELQDAEYFPLCSQCGWTKKMKGHDSVSIQPAKVAK